MYALFVSSFESSLVLQLLERHWYKAMEREADNFIHACNSVDGLVSLQGCPEDVVDASHEATPTAESRDQIGATPPSHVGMSEPQQRIVDSLQDAGNVRTH